jgi:hypothetical protein
MSLHIVIFILAAMIFSGAACAQSAPAEQYDAARPAAAGNQFRIKQGDASIEIRCAPDTPLKECAETAMRFV